MEIAKILLLIIQMGSAPSFPDGDVTKQIPLAEKVIVTCKTVDGELGKVFIDTLHIVKNNLDFKKQKARILKKKLF